MKSYINLWHVMADELAIRCHTSISRDFVTVARRVEDEGLSFLTITLPTFQKDFERSLSGGRVPDDAFLSFKKSAGLPVFLQGFLRNVFDEHAVMRPAIDDLLIDSIFAVRQLTGFFAKIELPCSKEREAQAVKDYLTADAEAGEWDNNPHVVLTDFARISHLLYRDVLTHVESSIHHGTLRPKHGPGAVADRLRGNAKFDLSYWPDRLNSLFNYVEWGIPNLRYVNEGSVAFQPSSVEPELPSRMILVPKTQKTPRVIAAEPASMQWMQQAIQGVLVPSLESSRIGPMIGFTDQQPNRDLARRGSLDGSLATLDMKEASDRVSFIQALAIGSNFPLFREAISATRSQLVKLPNGDVVPLKKFASMGSALCFPIEAMAFLAAVFVGIERKLVAEGAVSHQLSYKDVLSFIGSVRVYGDDIIVPVDCVSYVLDVFQQLGWKTNVNKSFWTGMFRESCGGDYFAGEDITIIRFRKDFPSARKDARKVASLVSLRNQLYWAGLWKTSGVLDERINRVLPYYPVVKPSASVLGRESVLDFKSSRTHPKYQSPLVRGFVLIPRIPRNEASEVGALLKCLLSSSPDGRHLTHSGRPSVVDIKLKWCTPY